MHKYVHSLQFMILCILNVIGSGITRSNKRVLELDVGAMENI